MDWEAAIAAAVRVAVAGRTMTKERWASDQEVSQWRQEGLCLQCGKDRHFVWDCHTKKPLHKGKKPHVAVAKTKKVTIALPRDEVDSDNELSSVLDKGSGKE